MADLLEGGRAHRNLHENQSLDTPVGGIISFGDGENSSPSGEEKSGEMDEPSRAEFS